MEYTNCKWCGSTIYADAARCGNCGRDAAGVKAQDRAKPEAAEAKPVPDATPDLEKTLGRFVQSYAWLAIPAIVALFFAWKIRADLRADAPALTGEAAKSAAMEQLGSADAKIRYQACQTLGSMDHPPAEALPTVAGLLKDPAENVRGSCGWAIGKYGSAAVEALPILISMLRDPSSYARMTAAGSLGEIASRVPADNQAVPALIEALHDKDDLTRRAAAGALNTMGDRAAPAIPILLAALNEHPAKDQFDVRVQIVQTLGSLAPKSNDIVPALTTALRDSDKGVRMRALEVLGIAGRLAHPAIPAVGKMIHDPDEQIRGAAVAALGKCCADTDETVPYLIDALRDRVVDVRKVAVFHLGEMGPRAKAAVPALIPVLSDSEGFLRPWAAEALGNMGPEAKAALPQLHLMLSKTVVTGESGGLLEAVKQAIQKIES